MLELYITVYKVAYWGDVKFCTTDCNSKISLERVVGSPVLTFVAASTHTDDTKCVYHESAMHEYVGNVLKSYTTTCVRRVTGN